jgi:predicted Zn-dependent protease
LSSHADDVKVQAIYATSLQKMGKYTEAKEAYKKVIEQDPHNLVALNNLAWLYMDDNDSRAIQLAEKAYEIKPDEPAVQDTYGWILVQHGQIDKGLDLLKQAMESLKNNPEVRYHYAVAMIESGNKEEGIKYLEALLLEGPDFQRRTEVERMLSNF